MPFGRPRKDSSESEGSKFNTYEDKGAGGHKVRFIVCSDEDTYWDKIAEYTNNLSYGEVGSTSSWKPGGFELAKTWVDVVGVGMGDSYKNCGQFVYFVNIDLGEEIL